MDWKPVQMTRDRGSPAGLAAPSRKLLRSGGGIWTVDRAAAGEGDAERKPRGINREIRGARPLGGENPGPHSADENTEAGELREIALLGRLEFYFLEFNKKN